MIDRLQAALSNVLFLLKIGAFDSNYIHPFPWRNWLLTFTGSNNKQLAKTPLRLLGQFAMPETSSVL